MLQRAPHPVYSRWWHIAVGLSTQVGLNSASNKRRGSSVSVWRGGFPFGSMWYSLPHPSADAGGFQATTPLPTYHPSQVRWLPVWWYFWCRRYVEFEAVVSGRQKILCFSMEFPRLTFSMAEQPIVYVFDPGCVFIPKHACVLLVLLLPMCFVKRRMLPFVHLIFSSILFSSV